jgi:hypothetical protein
MKKGNPKVINALPERLEKGNPKVINALPERLDLGFGTNHLPQISQRVISKAYNFILQTNGGDVTQDSIRVRFCIDFNKFLLINLHHSFDVCWDVITELLNGLPYSLNEFDFNEFINRYYQRFDSYMKPYMTTPSMRSFGVEYTFEGLLDNFIDWQLSLKSSERRQIHNPREKRRGEVTRDLDSSMMEIETYEERERERAERERAERERAERERERERAERERAKQCVSGIPSLNDIIPGTTSTYKDLFNALNSPTYNVGDIHRASRSMTNVQLAFDIMNRSIHPDSITLMTDAPTSEKNRRLIESFKEFLNESLSHSDRAGFKFLKRRQYIITKIFEVCDKVAMDGSYLRVFSSIETQFRATTYVVIFIIYNFIIRQKKAFQYLWSEIAVTDIFESYGNNVDDMGKTEESVSCLTGMLEQFLVAIRTTLNQECDDETGSNQKVSSEEINSRRKRLLILWSEAYFKSHTDPTKESLIAYFNNQIRNSEEDNNVIDWKVLIDEYVNSEGLGAMFGGGRKYNHLNFFSKKHKTSLKGIIKTKCLRKYKKKMKKCIKKSTKKRRRLLRRPTIRR